MVKKVIDEGLEDRPGDEDDDDNDGRFRDVPDDDDDEEISFEDEGEEEAEGRRRRKKPRDQDDDDDDDGDEEDEDGESDDEPGDKDDADEEDEEEDARPPEKSKDDDDDDLGEYSAKVRKRIERERRLKQQERLRADNAERELQRLREDQEAATVDKRLDAAIDELEDARRDADTRKEALAQAKVTRLSEEKEKHETRRQQAEKDGGRQGEAKPNPAYQAWLNRNGWFNNPKYATQRAAALAVANDLIADGDRDDNDAFYRKLDRRVRESVRLPTREKPEPRRSTLGRLPEAAGKSSSRVVITSEDKALMRRMGMDPTNKAHLQEYAKEKRNG